MAWIDKLKVVLPSSLPGEAYSYDIKLTGEQPPKSKNANKVYHIDTENKIIQIFIRSLSPKELRILKKFAKEAFADNLCHFVEDNKLSLLDSLYKYNQNNKEDSQTLTFFKKTLSNVDWEALRSSLYLRSEFKKKNNVTILKQDIKNKFGERGNVISNLCTAGYFESTMIPLFNKSEKEFWQYYDLAVDRGVTALFVNVGMTVDKIKSEINRILSSAKNYGLPYVHIHGIGKRNIDNIKLCIDKQKDNLSFTEKNILSIEDGIQILVVEIIL